MTVTPRRCLWASIASLLIGALVSIGWAELSTRLYTDMLDDRPLLQTTMSLVVSLVHWSALAIGSALLAASVIMSWYRQNLRTR